MAMGEKFTSKHMRERQSAAGPSTSRLLRFAQDFA
jgi:hypothetical protein